MKYITNLLALLSLATSTLTAEEHQKLNIEQATVFLKGAELVSTAKVSLKRGENELQFSNVAGDINTQSVIVAATNDVVTESVTFQNNYLTTDNKSEEVNELKDSIDVIQTRLLAEHDKITLIDELIEMLQTNKKVGGNNTGINVSDLQKMLDIVTNKMQNYLEQKRTVNAVIKKLNEQLNYLNRQIAEEQKSAYEPGGQLTVKLFAKESTHSDVTITYVIPTAGWSPIYDVIAADVRSPLNFYYKANIYQNSGVAWDNVHLVLSTGDPAESMVLPELSRWYLGFYTPRPTVLTANEIKNTPKTLTRDLVAQAPGIYQQKEGGSINADGGISDGNVYIADGVHVYGTRGIDMAQGVTTSMNQHTVVDNSGVGTTFDIDLPYTIPSDGQPHLVSAKKYNVPATYQYIAIPKIDKDAFLQAQIANWEDLNLLTGITNITYEGTYIGQGVIDPGNVKDTMRISLGRDKKVIVKRERNKTLTSTKTIGTNIREVFEYTITVRNTRKEPISILVEDQQPVSADNNIVIEDKDTGESEYDEPSGSMKWSLKLAPNEVKKLTFGYTVKYSKGRNLVSMK